MDSPEILYYKKRIVDLIKLYYTEENIKNLKKQLEKKDEMQRVCSRGGLNAHRGIYSKYILHEINCTNIQRGRILVRKSKKSPDYIYYFEEDKLKLIEKMPNKSYGSVELILEDNNKEIGIEIEKYAIKQKENGYITITEAFYNEYGIEEQILFQSDTDDIKKILRNSDYLDRSTVEVFHERYFYNDGKLHRGVLNRVTKGFLWHFEEMEYSFCYDEDEKNVECYYVKTKNKITLKPEIESFLLKKKVDSKVE